MKFEKYIHIYTPEKMTKTIQIHGTKIMNYENAFSKIFSELVKFFDIKTSSEIMLAISEFAQNNHYSNFNLRLVNEISELNNKLVGCF